MSFFFFAVFTIYGGMHVYAFLRARTAVGFGPAIGIAIALFMVLMVVAIFLVRSLELHEYERTARTLAYLAYLWMAVLFLFCCASLVLDFYNLLVHSGEWISSSDLSPYLIAPRLSFAISLGLAFVICVYGYFEALDIRSERVRIETGKLPAGVDRLIIVQVSDVHLGLIIRYSRFEKMIEAVKAAQPDIFISTGDLVDAQINHLTGLAELMREVQPRYGKYAITGNHEYYAGIERAIEFTKKGGFRVLRNEAVTDGPINIVGVNDRTGVRLGLEKAVVESALLARTPRDKFTLFLKHQPIIDPASLGLFDLQVSGHTHKGQIFPFTLLTLLTYPLNAGDYNLGYGSRLHVSRGTGTWGSPIRFLSPPEVTIYELVRKSVPSPS